MGKCVLLHPHRQSVSIIQNRNRKIHSGMPSSTPQHQHVSRSPGTIPLSERQQMALLSRMTEEQKQHHSNVSVNKHGETPLHIAAKQGSEDEVQELLSKGVDPNCPDAAGWTPLHEACIRGRYNVAKTLILAGADANAKGYQGFTPLHDAAANGHAELINLLLDFGADVTQRNHKGQAPVDVAPEPIKIIFKNQTVVLSTISKQAINMTYLQQS
ncbi:hypothetical protein M8J76_006885 [Diaphorina citri]|nr:hypothetical protein M8J76_006885 [Diaphorina citri]